jgi:energy-coupling factor transporter transmembrane protein EcfT
MKNLIKFILFLIYSVAIFFIKDYRLLVLVAIVNIVLMFILKINFKKSMQNLLKLFIFIAFTVIINLFFDTFKAAILIGIKLILVCNITYTFSKVLSYVQLAQVIEKILYPLKIFKINTRDIGIVVCIALTFIPILKEEFNQIKNVLEIKGFKYNIFNIIKNSNLVFKPFFISVLQRINELEDSIKIKGYQT